MVMSSDLLFQVVENEEDVIMKNGAPSETNQRLASQITRDALIKVLHHA